MVDGADILIHVKGVAGAWRCITNILEYMYEIYISGSVLNGETYQLQRTDESFFEPWGQGRKGLSHTVHKKPSMLRRNIR